MQTNSGYKDIPPHSLLHRAIDRKTKQEIKTTDVASVESNITNNVVTACKRNKKGIVFETRDIL